LLSFETNKARGKEKAPRRLRTRLYRTKRRILSMQPQEPEKTIRLSCRCVSGLCQKGKKGENTGVLAGRKVLKGVLAHLLGELKRKKRARNVGAMPVAIRGGMGEGRLSPDPHQPTQLLPSKTPESILGCQRQSRFI